MINDSDLERITATTALDRWRIAQQAQHRPIISPKARAIMRELPKSIEFWAWVSTIVLGLAAGGLVWTLHYRQDRIMERQQMIMDQVQKIDHRLFAAEQNQE